MMKVKSLGSRMLLDKLITELWECNNYPLILIRTATWIIYWGIGGVTPSFKASNEVSNENVYSALLTITGVPRRHMWPPKKMASIILWKVWDDFLPKW